MARGVVKFFNSEKGYGSSVADLRFVPVSSRERRDHGGGTTKAASQEAPDLLIHIEHIATDATRLVARDQLRR